MATDPVLNLPLQNINNFVPIKLTKANYLTWKTLFLPILKRFHLLGMVDGSSPCPSQFVVLIGEDGLVVTTLNPDYELWQLMDQTVLMWLNATISDSLLPYVIGLSTSRSVWEMLEKRFASISRSHVLQLKSKLQTLKKGSSSIDQYLHQAKDVTDSLAAAGHLDDTDLIFHTLNGLPLEYDSFST